MPDKIKFQDIGSDYEPSESEDEFSKKESQLLKLNVDRHRRDDDEDDEAVLEFDDEQDQDDDEYEDDEPDFDEIRKFEHDSDIDEANEDAFLPDRKAWGSKASAFYGTGYADRDYDGITAQEEELAQLEEEEAKEIQKRLLNEMSEADYLLDPVLFDTSGAAAAEQQADSGKSTKKKTKQSTGSKPEDVIVVEGDLSDLTESQKKDMFRKCAPEFASLVDECNRQLVECVEVMEPVLELLKRHNKLNTPFGRLLKKRYDVSLLYCSNIAFYVMLKAQKVPILKHPIVKRVSMIMLLRKKLDEKYDQCIRGQVEQLQAALAAGEPITFADEQNEEDAPVQTVNKKRNRFGILSQLEAKATASVSDDEANQELEDESEDEAYLTKKLKLLADHETASNPNEEDDDKDKEEEELDEEGKRKITYQMAKNKGLTVRKRRDQRNIRVKNKLKYRKALIRRKGAIRPVRTETTRYSGESSIKPFVKRGIKIK
ncbi:something about silencing protein 10-like [Anopheles albimanus]|uniref:Sas10 domain-containing protein n=1 Tax=Anopheles albimanus TaxID=7167 RepID=A0A182FPG5_ANOAL|nr:something about silencing protein 10-like [Anopheles albimanus]